MKGKAGTLPLIQNQKCYVYFIFYFSFIFYFANSFYTQNTSLHPQSSSQSQSPMFSPLNSTALAKLPLWSPQLKLPPVILLHLRSLMISPALKMAESTSLWFADPVALGIEVRACSVLESTSENAGSDLWKTLDLGLLLGLWYLFNICFNF